MIRPWWLMIALLVPRVAQAQTPEELLTRARAAFENLDFETAIRDYQRVLDISIAATRQLRDTAQLYLAVSYEFAGQRDNTLRTFRTLIRENPCTITPEEFGGSVSAAFVEARGGVFAAGLCVIQAQRLERDDSVRLTVATTRTAELHVYLHDATGAMVLDLGRHTVTGIANIARRVDPNPMAFPAAPAAHTLVIEAEESQGTGTDARTTIVLAHIPPPDTLTHPEPIPDSAFLPEERSAGSAWGDLAKGLGIGVGVTAVTAGLAYASLEAEPAKVVAIGGTISLVGFVAFFKGSADRAIPENQAQNERRRRQWLEDRARVISENATRGRARYLVIEPAGDPQ